MSDAGPPAGGYVEALRSGRMSSLELTGAYLDRIEALDASVRAYVTVDAERAREAAAAADAALAAGEPAKPLHGLPVALKDNIDTAGMRTTVGSAFFADRVPGEDAAVARRLFEAGAVLLGKTALHEFAYGATTQNPHHGCCRNPWDLERIPGGSSGGSGAALGADLAAAAVGTDTGGSVRIPAALNGVSGLRPTFGRVSARAIFPLCWTLDTAGPMARSVEDVARVFDVLDGYDPADPVSATRSPAPPPAQTDGIRLGVLRGYYARDVDADVAVAVDGAGELLARLAASVDEVELPDAEDAFAAGNTIIRAEAYAIHRDRLAEAPDRFGEDVRRRLLLGEEIGGADYADARQAARVWRRSVEAAFSQADVLLAPVTGTAAPLAADCETIETTRRLALLTYGFSLAGVPALAVPCGLSRGGLPVGLQLVGARWHDATLLALGAAFQRETDWHLRRPAALAAVAPG